MKRVLVIGAAGDVGQGVVAVLLERGHEVVAAGRNAARLEKVAKALNAGPKLRLLAGTVESDASAAALVKEAGPIDAAVVSVNAPGYVRPLLEHSADELADVFRSNLITHFIAARALLPALANGGVLIGVGGGMADFIVPGMGHMNIVQAGIRNFYRALAGENKSGAIIRELLIASMVNGESKRAIADAKWITDRDIGEHVAAILADIAAFPDTVITLRSRKQVGRPPEKEAKPA